MKIVRLIKRIYIFSAPFCGYVAAATAFHEIYHFLVNLRLGGLGEIFYNWSLTSGHMDWITAPAHHIWLVYLAGGFLTALTMTVCFWLPPRLTTSKADLYVEAAVAGPILAHLFYAPAELFLYINNIKLYEWASIAAGIVASTLFSLLYAKQIIKWFNYPSRRESGQTERVP